MFYDINGTGSCVVAVIIKIVYVESVSEEIIVVDKVASLSS